MIEDEVVRELRRVKDEIAEQYDSNVYKIATAARRFAKSHPLPAAGKKRKSIKGHPLGHSVAEDDEVMRELRQTRSQMLAEHGNDPRQLLESFQRKPGTSTVQSSRKKRSPRAAVRKGIYKKSHGSMTNSANKLR